MGPGFESQRDHNKKIQQYQGRINRMIYAAFLFLAYKAKPLQTNLNGNKKGYTAHP